MENLRRTLRAADTIDEDHRQRHYPRLHQLLPLLLHQNGHPPGCLLAEYRLAYDDLGPTTQALVREMVKEYRSMLHNWLQACATQGDIPQSTDLDFAAQYVDSCLRNAATIAKRGGDPQLVAKNFLTSLQVLNQDSAKMTHSKQS